MITLPPVRLIPWSDLDRPLVMRQVHRPDVCEQIQSLGRLIDEIDGQPAEVGFRSCTDDLEVSVQMWFHFQARIEDCRNDVTDDRTGTIVQLGDDDQLLDRLLRFQVEGQAVQVDESQHLEDVDVGGEVSLG